MLKIIAMCLGLICTYTVNAANTTTQGSQSSYQPSQPLVKCPTDGNAYNRFALCATATCWTLDSVAYCKCEVLNEQSISLSFNYQENGQDKNVCDLLLQGKEDEFTVSTYATPRQLEADYNPKEEKLGPPMGFYTCSGQTSDEAYSAQCDGGICFNSTQGESFPGLGYIKDNEIVCACPPSQNPTKRFQIAGPWSCEPGAKNENNECCDQDYYNQMCSVSSVSTTGTKLAVGAPAGGAMAFSKLLDGSVPKLNACRFK
ncbi:MULTISPECIES: hypothetical protein [Pseudoalteromonas]|uniref:Uncharacterized protein n=1 Tax=Pseudoalteromonas amylolytica TaxID=1859457 RepID=A0A1S1MRL7_9GAMM|nr:MULTISPECIES: hypothetical protein [Pseudoalteromonas]OHU87925.1 hypothetical protein BFC16_10985 [Pseudoalteromonas sp. JW3]OHU91365.1 hypothetical protein BET10_11105 [Pseudoalteromonas amylolytica]